MKRPVIGISAANIFNERMYSQRITYPQAIEAAGGLPLLLPCLPSAEHAAQVVSLLDGLLVPGGADVEPSFYGEERLPECGSSLESDDVYDLALIREAARQGKPILAICRGMQLVNTAFGGTLYQDIPAQTGSALRHPMLEGGIENYHTAAIAEGSRLARILGAGEIRINSSHHQAVKMPAKGFTVTAKAPDGIVEAMESADGRILCVQWHPERMVDEERFRHLFEMFVEQCTESRQPRS